VRALVTGGAGFIGSHICDALLARDYQVRILDNLEPRVHPRGRPAYVRSEIGFVKGDVRDRSALECALADVEVIFHEAGHQGCMPEYAKLLHSNVVSTAMLFEVIRENRFAVTKVVIASSQAVYGEGQYCCPSHGLVQGEPRRREDLENGDWETRCPECRGNLVPVLLRESRANPTNIFGVSKFAEEMTALRLGQDLGIPVVVLRYSTVQGARQSFYNAYSGICRNFMRAIQSGRAPLIFEDGMQLRDYVHVSDVVAANLLVLENSTADGETFNVGTGRANSVLDYARVLAHRMNSHVAPEIPGIYRVGDARHNVSSIAKLEALGWKASKGLSEIFDDYLAWLQATPDTEDYASPAFTAMQRAGVLRLTARPKAKTAQG